MVTHSGQLSGKNLCREICEFNCAVAVSARLRSALVKKEQTLEDNSSTNISSTNYFATGMANYAELEETKLFRNMS